MDIRDYQYIVTIAEQHSISRAAASLYITQSALTRFLQRIEEELGIPLFLRKGHQCLPTEAGLEYVEAGRIIMKLDREITQKLLSKASFQKKIIRIGYGMGLAEYMQKSILTKFHSAYPEMKINVKLDSSRHLMMDLENDYLDLAIITNIEQKPGFQYHPFEKSFPALAVRDDSPLLQQAEVRDNFPYPVIPFHALKNQFFITVPSSSHSGVISHRIFQKYLPDIHISMEISDIRSALDAVENGFGVSIILFPKVALRKHLRFLSLENTFDLTEYSYLVHRSELNITPAYKYIFSLLLRD